MDEELSLRDIADILGRYKALLIGLPLLTAATAFTAASLTPRSFTSLTVVTLNNNTPSQTRIPSAISLDPSLLPSAPALTQAYELAAPRRLAAIWNVEPSKVPLAFEADYDEKSNAITLSAQADAPVAAQRRAEEASNDFVQYANNVVTSVISEAYRSRLQQARSELQGNELVLRNLRRSLEKTPSVLTGEGQPSGRASAGGAGLDPRFAGNSDQPANPAYAFIAVRIAEAEAEMAGNAALVTRLETSLRNPEQLLSLARQSTQINVLAQANVPTEPDGVGRGVVTALGFILGGLLAVVLAFVLHALRRPPAPGSAREPVAQRSA